MTEVSREVCGDLIKESETRMMAYSESHVEKKIDALADGLLATNERIGRLTEHMDDMNETFLNNTVYIVKDARDKGQALWFCPMSNIVYVLQYQKKLLATHHTVEQYTSGVFSSLDSALKQLDFFKAQYDANPDYYAYQRKESAAKEE